MRYCLFVFVVIAYILPSFAAAQAEGTEEGIARDLLLLDSFDTALKGIEQVQVVLHQPEAELKTGTIRWESIQAVVVSAVSSGGIKVVDALKAEGKVVPANLAELRIDVQVLEFKDSQNCVFSVRTSLARTVYLTRDLSHAIKTNVWETAPVMEIVSAQTLPDVIEKAVTDQAKAFVHSYLMSNPKPVTGAVGEKSTATGDAQKTQPPAAARPDSVKYPYVASKNSDIFHKAECSSVVKIKSENLIGYKTRDEALQAGKRPCKRCQP
jgi:hypothetical protein